MSAITTQPAQTRRWRYRLSERWTRLRAWLLEDSANKGLGGPPNNWQSVKAARRDNGIGQAEYGARFLDDASAVGVWVRYHDDPGDEGHWLCTMPRHVFRRFALWYLWRWVYGEWFGMRRRLYYHWLHRHVARMMVHRRAE